MSGPSQDHLGTSLAILSDLGALLQQLWRGMPARKRQWIATAALVATTALLWALSGAHSSSSSSSCSSPPLENTSRSQPQQLALLVKESIAMMSALVDATTAASRILVILCSVFACYRFSCAVVCLLYMAQE